MNLLKTALQLASPANAKAKLSILIFHRVLPEIDPIFPDEPDARRFDLMMGWINSWFNVLALDAAVDALKKGNLPARAAAITFDDGYADNRTVALPILKKHGLPATFFIATSYLDGGRMWNDTIIEAVRASKTMHLDLSHLPVFVDENMDKLDIGTNLEKRAAIELILGKIKYLPKVERAAAVRSIGERCGSQLPDDLMMTSQQVIEMRRAGMLIGAHTLTHPILAKLDATEVRNEIAGSKHRLESLLEEKISLFAYPNGKPNQDYQSKDAQIIEELGFDAALTTAWGVADGKSDLMQLPRFTPWDNSKRNFGTRLFKNILLNQGLKANQLAN
ncbi:MAG: polysaccharide deacetylase family protein [Azonexus sp.]|nr:polysaccharide deacetylase family protein [Azonexus sp.]